MAMTLRLTPEQDELLTRLAAADGVSKQEAAVRAINETAQRHLDQRDVDLFSARYRARYADVLRRLGE